MSDWAGNAADGIDDKQLSQFDSLSRRQSRQNRSADHLWALWVSSATEGKHRTKKAISTAAELVRILNRTKNEWNHAYEVEMHYCQPLAGAVIESSLTSRYRDA